MLKEKIEQVKTFVAGHKKEIAIGVCVAVGGVVVYKIVKKTLKIDSMSDVVTDDSLWDQLTELEIPELEVGTIEDLWKDQWGKSLILNDITVADMGKIGEEFLKIEGVTKDTVVTASVGLLDGVILGE